MYNFGTVVLVPFPFTDLSQAKLRPALVVSRGLHGDDVIVAFITTQNIEQGKGPILAEGTDTFRSAGLKKTSKVRFDKIATLHKGLFMGELGYIPKETLASYRDEWISIFGF